MLQSLDIVTIQISARVKGRRVRRCKQIIEIVDIDPTTKEILTNEVFRWDPLDDKFTYSGKSYILERVRARWDISKEQILEEMKRRVEILEWMCKTNVRSFKDVAEIVSLYVEKPEDFMKKMKMLMTKGKSKKDETDNKTEQQQELPENKDTIQEGMTKEKKKRKIGAFRFKKLKLKKRVSKGDVAEDASN